MSDMPHEVMAVYMLDVLIGVWTAVGLLLCAALVNYLAKKYRENEPCG